MGLSSFLINIESLLECCRDSKFVELDEVQRVKHFVGTKKKRFAVASEVKVLLWVVLVPRLNLH